jgi:acyl-coenzyme A thioesterase PaaI-like protein
MLDLCSVAAMASWLSVVACVITITMVVDYDRPQSGFVTVDLSPLMRQAQEMQQL